MGINEEPTPRRPRPPPLTALEKLTASPIAVPNPRRMSTGIYDYPDGQKCGMKIFNSVRLAALSGRLNHTPFMHGLRTAQPVNFVTPVKFITCTLWQY